MHAGEAPLLGPIIAEFCASHPGVELQCDTRMAGEQALREDMDLAIVFHRGDQDDSTLVTRELASLPSLVVGAPGLIARAGMPTRTAQLKTLPCITTGALGQPWRFVDTAGRMVPVRSHYRVNSGWRWRARARVSAMRFWRPVLPGGSGGGPAGGGAAGIAAGALAAAGRVWPSAFGQRAYGPCWTDQAALG